MIIKIAALICLFVAVIFGITHYLGPDDLAGCPARPTSEDRCRTADAIIAISGGDTAARADEAIKLYQNGWAPKLVFSGAAQDETGPSNAAAMKKMAIEAGVPEEDILIDETGRTTQQNAEETHALLASDSVSSVIVVTSAYHQRRADLEFERVFGVAAVRNHPVKQDKQWTWLWWTTPRGWYLAIGELAKISVFYLEELRL